MTTQFSGLTEATALVAGDELAVARGAATVRLAIALIRAGLTGDQDGAAIVALLEALTGANRLDANAALRNLQTAIDTATGSTDWRTPGGMGTADGVLSALALAADGTVSATITGGTDFTADFGPSIIALAAGGGTTLTTTIKQPVHIGGPEDVNIAAADRFYDSGIDMPATADIDDDDYFIFSMQYRATGNAILQTMVVLGADWKRLEALTAAEQSQTSFSADSSAKTITAFLRRTSTSGGQAQQNAYVAKGADGVSLYVGDNNDPFDATVQVTELADAVITGLQGPTGPAGGFTLRRGSGTPADTLGDDDDWYLNTANGAWFTKTGGAWGNAVYTDMVGAGTTDGVINSLAAALDANNALTITAGRTVGGDVANATPLALPFLLLAGGALTGALTGTSATFSAALTAASAAFTGALSAGATTLTGLLTGTTATFSGQAGGQTPVNDADFTTKAYVDAAVAGITPPTPRQESIYYGQIGSVADAATVDVSTLTNEDATVAGHNVSIGPSIDGMFFVFLVPSDHAILTLINTGLNVDVLSTYTRTDDVRMLGTPAENYHAYTFGPLNAGLTVHYRMTLTE